MEEQCLPPNQGGALGAIRVMMQKKEKETEEQSQQACKKAGHGKKKFNKTLSNMKAMMALVSELETKPSAKEKNMHINNAMWTGLPPSISALQRHMPQPTLFLKSTSHL